MMVADDISPHSEFQIVFANGSSLDNKDNEDLARTAVYEDLVESADLFWEKLRDFLGYSDKFLNIPVPVVGGKNLNVHRLFIEVTSRGGIEKVIKERKCKEVTEAFNYNETVTNAAFVLRTFYLKMLFKFGHVYYFQEPISSFSTKEEAVKLLSNKPAKHDKDTQELKIGSVVYGIIDWKFDDGYLVSVNVGSRKFKGVFYNVPQAETSSRKCKKNFTTEADMTDAAAVATTEAVATKIAVAAMTDAAVAETTEVAVTEAVTVAETDASTAAETDTAATETATATENEAAETDVAVTEAETGQ